MRRKRRPVAPSPKHLVRMTVRLPYAHLQYVRDVSKRRKVPYNDIVRYGLALAIRDLEADEDGTLEQL